MIPPLQKLLNQVRGEDFSPTILALDPGETTGWAIMKKHEVLECGQEVTKPAHLIFPLLERLHKDYTIEYLVFENYRIYKNKAKAQINSEVLPVQVIGIIKLFIFQKGIKQILQMAAQAKGFATDDKLKEWGLYKVGLRHSRDAIRHAVFFSIFGKLS